MKPELFFPPRSSVLLASMLALSACGGGDGGGGTAAATIHGVAAAGAPIVGQVTVKDANGTLRTVDIALDGSYTVNVDGLTAPFLFRAQGTVGDRSVALVSAATGADINGNINITPFTDLMVANIAGQVADAYFAGTPSAATLTPAALNAARDALTARIAPVLSELGVAAGFDLLRQTFTANHTGFDQVMDTVRVTVDPLTNTALIRDIINNTTITDDLTVQTDASVIAAPPAGSLSAAISDLQAITQMFSLFSAQYVSSVPTSSNAVVQATFSQGFLNDGNDRDTFLAEVTSDAGLVGLRIGDVAIVPDAANSSTVKHVSFMAAIPGEPMESEDTFVRKEGGTWKWDGNRHSVGNVLRSTNHLNLAAGSAFGVPWATDGDQYYRALSLGVDYAPPAVEYLQVDGPGIAAGSVMLHRNTMIDGWEILDADGSAPLNSQTELNECGTQAVWAGAPCIDFGSVQNDAEYTFTPRDSAQATLSSAPAYTKTLMTPPFSDAEAAAHKDDYFATFVSVTPAYNLLANAVSVTVTLQLPADPLYRVDHVGYGGDNSLGDVQIDMSPVSAAGTQYRGTWSGSAPLSQPRLWVHVDGPMRRMFTTAGVQPAP